MVSLSTWLEQAKNWLIGLLPIGFLVLVWLLQRRTQERDQARIRVRELEENASNDEHLKRLEELKEEEKAGEADLDAKDRALRDALGRDPFAGK